MAPTPYSKICAAFSDAAHMKAREKLYPDWFGVPADEIVWDEGTLLHHGEKGQVLDGEMAIDRVPRLPARYGLKVSIPLMLQERFRGRDKKGYRDLTITEYNGNGDLPSELAKFPGGFFAFGYMNVTVREWWKLTRQNSELAQSYLDFIEAWLIVYGMVKWDLITNQIPWERRFNKKGQSFIAIKFAVLEERGYVVAHYRAPLPAKQLPLWERAAAVS